jgi:hypothetical protein
MVLAIVSYCGRYSAHQMFCGPKQESENQYQKLRMRIEVHVCNYDYAEDEK